MKERRFFSKIWRINALLILGAGTVIVLGLLASLGLVVFESTRTRQVSNIVNVSGDDISEITASLSSFEDLPGTDVLRAPLTVEQSYDFRSSAKKSASIQNYLFFDPTTRSTYWLQEDSQGLILSNSYLPEQPPNALYNEQPETPPLAVIYTVVEQDTNDDGFLSSNDTPSLAISDVEGTRFAVILEAIDRLYGTTINDANNALILYTLADQLKVAEIDLTTYQVINQTDLNDLGALEELNIATPE
ncbi:MAG: hypothetical protein AAGF24_10200 [Cyanobacteria bacterium P01_H01_bin.121]